MPKDTHILKIYFEECAPATQGHTHAELFVEFYGKLIRLRGILFRWVILIHDTARHLSRHFNVLSVR